MPRKHGEKAAVKTNPRMLRNRMRTFMTAHLLMRAQFILMALFRKNVSSAIRLSAVSIRWKFIHSVLDKIHAAFINTAPPS